MSNGHASPAHGGTSESKSPAKQSVAIIGFIVIAILGISIAVYASRFVPGAISGLAGAGAYVSNLFILEDGEKTTIVEEPADEVEEPAVEEKPVVVPATTTPSRPVTPRPQAPAYYGLGDLTVSINAVGYCTTGAQNSFVASSRVPDTARYGGVRFTVTNVGTNVSGSWSFGVETPASPSDSYEYAGQASLAPGQSTIGTLCFPRGTRANDGEVTVSVGGFNESSTRNNEDSEDLEIAGWDD